MTVSFLADGQVRVEETVPHLAGTAEPFRVTPPEAAGCLSVLIKAKATGRIFDVDNLLRVFEYDPNLWRSTLDSDLPNLRDHVKGGWDTRDSSQTYMKILRKGSPKPE